MRPIAWLTVCVALLFATEAAADAYYLTNSGSREMIGYSFGDHDFEYEGPDLGPGSTLPSNLRDMILTNANFAGVNAAGASMTDTVLNRANLRGANFSGAGMFEAFFVDADLSGANLSGAYLDLVRLGGANLSGADLSGAYIFPNGKPFYDLNTNFTGATTFILGPDGTEPFVPSEWGWTLIPEPSSALLVGLGLIGLGSANRRHFDPR